MVLFSILHLINSITCLGSYFACWWLDSDLPLFDQENTNISQGEQRGLLVDVFRCGRCWNIAIWLEQICAI